MNPSDSPQPGAIRAVRFVCGTPTVTLTWLVWLALLLGYLGPYGWLFDLFANFRVQYMGLFALCVVALTIAQRRRMAIVALLGVAFTTWSMAGYFVERNSQPSAATASFRLVTFNTWFRNDDFTRVAQYLEHSQADVIVLQEIDEDRAETLKALMTTYPFRTISRNVRHRVVVLSRWPVIEVEDRDLAGRVARASFVSVDWRGTPITVLGTHLHWPLGSANFEARTEELIHLSELAQRESGPLIVAGDFNLTPWSRFFGDFVNRSGLRDCALRQGLLATWPSQALPARIKIDQCFISSHWRVRRATVGPRIGSDHLPFVIDLELKKQRTSKADVIPDARRAG